MLEKFNIIFYQVLEAVLSSFTLPKGKTLTVAFYCSLGITTASIISSLLGMIVVIHPIGAGVASAILGISIILERRDVYELHRVYRGLQISVNHPKARAEGPDTTEQSEAGTDVSEQHTTR